MERKGGVGGTNGGSWWYKRGGVGGTSTPNKASIFKGFLMRKISNTVQDCLRLSKDRRCTAPLEGERLAPYNSYKRESEPRQPFFFNGRTTENSRNLQRQAGGGRTPAKGQPKKFLPICFSTARLVNYTQICK